MAEETNPLHEASKASLAELFAMDPLALTKSDRAVIVAEFRRMRALWATAEAQGKTTTAAKAPKAIIQAPSLEDLLK